jgi:hypothetical protein
MADIIGFDPLLYVLLTGPVTSDLSGPLLPQIATLPSIHDNFLKNINLKNKSNFKKPILCLYSNYKNVH